MVREDKPKSVKPQTDKSKRDSQPPKQTKTSGQKSNLDSLFASKAYKAAASPSLDPTLYSAISIPHPKPNTALKPISTPKPKSTTLSLDTGKENICPKPPDIAKAHHGIPLNRPSKNKPKVNDPIPILIEEVIKAIVQSFGPPPSGDVAPAHQDDSEEREAEAHCRPGC